MKLEDIANNGVIGAGGAGFPTHVKLAAKAEFMIMNAAECEPLLHKDKELLMHFPDQVVEGMQAACQLTGAREGIIGIKEKYEDIIEFLKKKLPANISVRPIGDFYPAGDEVTLVYATTGRLIQPGKLPSSVNCVVNNVETLYNIGCNRPVTEKFVSIAGAVADPVTIKVPIGTSYKDILDQVKVTTAQYVIFSNGLMMGTLEQKPMDLVVTKRTSAIIVLPADHYCVRMHQRYKTEAATIRMAKAGCDQCNFCTEFCPRYILGYPVRPETAMRNRMFSPPQTAAVFAGNLFCCECNLCTLYSCPEGLDPRGSTLIEKRKARTENIKWEGLPRQPHPMFNYRKVPTKKLKQRLDILRFTDEGPLQKGSVSSALLRVLLHQHAGAPAESIVSKGQRVKTGELIAKMKGTISANLHAPASGTVTDVSNMEIAIKKD